MIIADDFLSPMAKNAPNSFINDDCVSPTNVNSLKLSYNHVSNNISMQYIRSGLIRLYKNKTHDYKDTGIHLEIH